MDDPCDEVVYEREERKLKDEDQLPNGWHIIFVFAIVLLIAAGWLAVAL